MRLYSPGKFVYDSTIHCSSSVDPQDAVRLCATQWANKLFPFDHPPARYICVVAAGDAKLEVSRLLSLAGDMH